MKIYRIERAKYLATVLEGIGASRSEGNRWNSLNTRMIYAAESRALALLELSVHLNIHEDLPGDRFMVEIHIPDSIEIQELDLRQLPSGWDSKPPNSTTRRIGDQFVEGLTAAVLKVPSAIVAEEYNYLINPLHPDSKKITVGKSQLLNFDSRIKNK